MKQYEVTLTGHYEKTISVYADSPEQAAEKLKIILFDTDLIDFSDEDFVCGEADIAEADGDYKVILIEIGIAGIMEVPKAEPGNKECRHPHFRTLHTYNFSQAGY